ncbi:MAG: 50S ribosomal protein L29 [Smithellaceae bacterium]|nr:50S ribosomal protein L29 [Smithellaceae bacterium]
MKIEELRNLSGEELNQALGKLVDEGFRFRIQHTSNQLESTASLTRVRRDIARVKTVLREREIGQHGK